MATLKQQIESHIPGTLTIDQEIDVLSWLKEIQYVLIHIVDESHAHQFTKTYEVTIDGLDIQLFRFFTPHKEGIKAGIYPQHVYSLMTKPNYTGIYQASENAPAATIKDGKIYIFPNGGHIDGFGVVTPTDLSGDTIESMPMPFRSACIYYVAIQLLKHLLMEENSGKDSVGDQTLPAITANFPALSREAFADAIALGAHPTAPTNPTLSADQATDPSVTAPNISSPSMNSGADGEMYNKENLDLVFTKVDGRSLNDDIEMLNGEISILQKQVQEAQTRMQDELNRVNTLIAGYQSQVQHSLEQGRLTASANSEQAQLKLNQELSNAQTKLQAAIEEKRLLLSNYQNEVSSIVSENQTKIAEFEANASVWARKNDLNVTEFTTETQRVLSKYQTDIQAEFEKHQSEVRKVATNINASDSKIQGFLQSIQLLTQQFSTAMESYMTSVQRDKYISAPINPEQ